jgi:hypothetical protein
MNKATDPCDHLTSSVHVERERLTRTQRNKFALVASGSTAAVVVVGLAVAWSKAGFSLPVARNVSVPSQAAEAVRRSASHQVPVRQHVRRQRYGSNLSSVKEIIIHEHVRGPKAA